MIWGIPLRTAGGPPPKNKELINGNAQPNTNHANPNPLVAYKLQNTPHPENPTPDVKISIKNKEYTAY
jgi:hypothetical protein